ncbi:hypothetical protein ACHAO2_005546 [Verticillium nonalfalfae]
MGLYLQGRCARYLDRGSSSFFAISKLTYPNAAVLFDAAIAVKCFGVGVSYMIIIGDLMPKVILGFNSNTPELHPYLTDRNFWITAFMFLVIPLAFLRRLDSLKYTSIVALVSIGVVGVVGFSIGGAASMYLLVAITGYLTFGNDVNGNIVSMYAPSIATFIGQIGIVILVTFSIPLQVHPCRASLDAVLKWRPNRAHTGNGRSNSPVGGRSDHAVAPMSDLRFAVLTTLILVFGYLVALSVTSLERVLAYVGSIGSTSISFILPGLFYYKISDPESVHHQKLLKEDDDAAELHEDSDIEDSAAMVTSIQSLGSAASVAIDPRKWRKKWRWDLEHLEHDLLRKVGLALAIYGICVMTVCLVMNIVFHTSH